MALRQGLEALSQGLLRQMEIGGVAYKDATVKESERRAETRQMAAERRALGQQQKAWDREERLLLDREAREERLLLDRETREERLLTEARAHEKTTFGEQLKLTQKSDMQAWIKKNAMQNQAAFKLQRQQNLFDLRKQIDAAEGTAQVEMLKIRAQRMGELSDQIESIWEHRPDNAKWNPDSLKWDDDGVWKDELEAARRAYNKAASGIGLEPLIENADGVKYGKDARTIFTSMQQARGGAETEAWDDLMKGLIAKKDSDSYKSTVETLNESIDKYVKDPNNAYTQFTGAELHKLKKEVLEFFKYKAYGFEARDEGDGKVVDPTKTVDPAKSEVFGGDPAYQAGVGVGKAVNAIIEAFKNMGDIGTQIQGSAIGKRINQWETEEGLTPEEIITRIKDRVSNAPETERRVWQIFLDRLAPSPQTGDPDLAMAQSPRGMLNQPGMLQMFNTGPELDYSPEAVRSRTEGIV